VGVVVAVEEAAVVAVEVAAEMALDRLRSAREPHSSCLPRNKRPAILQKAAPPLRSNLVSF